MAAAGAGGATSRSAPAGGPGAARSGRGWSFGGSVTHAATSRSWSSRATAAAPPNTFRLMDRSAPFGQSQGRVAVRRLKNSEMERLTWQDPFHSLVHHSTVKIIAFFCLSYAVTHFIFACVYFTIDDSCDLRIKSLLDAFYSEP
ncbi:unnamed protein product [Prorocentrum cordatum]|uniref:Uncharacterized protein n=1 Tax=Prorocentrum cordatum TaxID=2364126 RepID=A0ABN9Q820_9DINO|nr:unnamed protein product [Polarella glacialis]